MKTRHRQPATRIALPLLAMLLSACGGGGTATPAAVDGRTISGQAAKGPLHEATVQVYVLDTRGAAVGAALAQAVTDEYGNWSLTVPGGDQPLVAVSSGGRYVDEADPEPDPAQRRSVQLEAGDRFQALVPPGVSSVAINAYTDALLRKSRFETEGDNFYSVHANNRVFLERAFGFDLLTTMPADPIRPDAGAGQAARQYAMALGGIANVVNAYAIANQQTIADFAIIDAVIDDLTDCIIDGIGVGGPVQATVTLASDLNTEILRFRNNNLSVYSNTALLEIDTGECARSGRIPDVTPPQFSNVPAALTVAAVDAQGTPATDAAIQALLSAVVATDDRDGPVTPVSDIPAVLPLGVTQVTFTATDRAGNAAEAIVVITVADLDAPTIVAPPDRDVSATGSLTLVDLGTPTIADNVTPAAGLVLANDAPAQGFPAGIHTVTWVVSDAAGLSAQSVQTITVRNAAPVVVNPLADQAATEGQPFSVSLAGAFADTDSSLDFSLAGLPAGSGLSFNPGSGLLNGIPNDIDAQASPLALTVTAMDETTPVSDQFVLTVTDVNNPPSFSVSGDIVLDEDFATPVVVTVTPDPVTPGDVNDVVYTLDAASVDFAALAIDSASGAVTIGSLPNANGQGSLRITADDGAAINNLYSLEVGVTVNAVNDPPVFALDGAVEVVPGFNGTAVVDPMPAAVPADESTQTVSYSIDHSVTYATIAIDSTTGAISISDVAEVNASAVLVVTADDGQAANNLHSEALGFVVRDSDKLVFAGEPVDDPSPPISPVFPNPSIVPLSFEASGMPASMSMDRATGILSGTATESDVDVGVFSASIVVTGSDGTVATFPLVIRVAERDTDLDGLPDRFEPAYGTDPNIADSDGDTVGDGVEVEAGTDPLVRTAKVLRVSSDERLRAISNANFAAASALAPVFILIEPGTYTEALRLQAPCDHVSVVGGLRPGVGYPEADRRTVLSSPVAVTGCAMAGLHHVGVIALGGSAVTVAGAKLSLGNVAITSADGQALDSIDSTVVVSDSVVETLVDHDLVVLADASLLRIEDTLLAARSQVNLFVVSPDSRVELTRVENTSPLQPGPDVVVADPVTIDRQHPDSAGLDAVGALDLLATLSFRGHELPRGYRLEARHGPDTLTVYDINRGRYLIESQHELVPEMIMLFVDGTSIPFVIESTPSR